jgi:hypothetical protein
LPTQFASADGSSTFWSIVSGASLCGLAALPISLGAGILKFRLYEIDRLISRTISYAIVTSTLIGVFVAIVGLTTRVLPFSSPVAVDLASVRVELLHATHAVRPAHESVWIRPPGPSRTEQPAP